MTALRVDSSMRRLIFYSGYFSVPRVGVRFEDVAPVPVEVRFLVPGYSPVSKRNPIPRTVVM